MRQRDLLFEAVAGACGIDWTKGLDPRTRGMLNRCVGALRQIEATPEEVYARASRFRGQYGRLPSPTALEQAWASLTPAAGQQAGGTDSPEPQEGYSARVGSL